MSDIESALAELVIDHRDEVAVAISDQLSPHLASLFASRINERLSQAALPRQQQSWIIATTGDDEAAARIASAVSDVIAQARVLIHDPRAVDELTFERRLPGQRRGGVYLNHAWQSASVRIACGDPLALVDGLSAWFNRRPQLRREDLDAVLIA